MNLFAGGCRRNAEVNFDEILTTSDTQDTEGFSTVLIDENGNVLTVGTEDIP